MRVAAPVILTSDQERQLRAVARAKTVSVRFALRARMILLAGQGWQDLRAPAGLTTPGHCWTSSRLGSGWRRAKGGKPLRQAPVRPATAASGTIAV